MIPQIHRVCVIAPHPDDETLGCGGTLLKLKAAGAKIAWLLVTSMLPEHGFSLDAIRAKENDIERLRQGYNFARTVRLHIPTTKVDQVPTDELVMAIGASFSEFQPDTVFIPFCHDAHSDHYHISKATLSCCKWFRYPFVRNVLFYETISETDFNLNTTEQGFRPNLYVNISDFFEEKLELLRIFTSELGEFPFPRSLESVEAIAKLRGTQCGARRAEAFELLRGCL